MGDETNENKLYKCENGHEVRESGVLRITATTKEDLEEYMGVDEDGDDLNAFCPVCMREWWDAVGMRCRPIE